MALNVLKSRYKRLEEIASGNTGREVAEGIEHFQNQFLIHIHDMDDLKLRTNEEY